MISNDPLYNSVYHNYYDVLVTTLFSNREMSLHSFND